MSKKKTTADFNKRAIMANIVQLVCHWNKSKGQLWYLLQNFILVDGLNFCTFNKRVGLKIRNVSKNYNTLHSGKLGPDFKDVPSKPAIRSVGQCQGKQRSKLNSAKSVIHAVQFSIQ